MQSSAWVVNDNRMLLPTGLGSDKASSEVQGCIIQRNCGIELYETCYDQWRTYQLLVDLSRPLAMATNCQDYGPNGQL